MPKVTFTACVDQALGQQFARELVSDPECVVRKQAELGEILQRAFTQAAEIMVQQLSRGFRQQAYKFVLHVEVHYAGFKEQAIVKLDKPQEMQHELQCWNSCRPQGLKHDLVLMDLNPVRNSAGDIIALVYEDAEQFIGVDEILTLEEAILAAVRLGEPSLLSVTELLYQLYERLGLLLYRYSFDDYLTTVVINETKDQDTNTENHDSTSHSPPHRIAGTYKFEGHKLDPHLSQNLQLWSEHSEFFKIRAGITTELDNHKSRWKYHFTDPASLFMNISNIDLPLEEIPRVLRGKAHGDLHGRNILVGKIGERVLWPAVYDYGDMRSNNLIAWDFVKLETELKIRAYPMIFRDAQHFIPQVVEFEVGLHLATEQARLQQNWKTTEAFKTGTLPDPKARLHWILLQLRQYAQRHLSQQSRHGLWLMEYYLVLAAYGLNSARFRNLQPLEIQGAYLSSGCAASRFIDQSSNLQDT